MNERIRELVKKAVEAVDIVTGNEALDNELAKMYIPDCFSEKFAELLIKECMDNLAWHGHDDAVSQLEWFKINKLEIK